MDIKSKLLERHKEDCSSLENVEQGIWAHPWHLLGAKHWLHNSQHGRSTEGHMYMTKNGAQSRGCNERWLVALCHDPSCDAQIAVREEDVLSNIIQDGLPGDTRKAA